MATSVHVNVQLRHAPSTCRMLKLRKKKKMKDNVQLIEVFDSDEHEHRLNMNKWSTSLPSILSVSSDIQIDGDPMFLQPTAISSPSSSATTTTIAATSKIHRSLSAYGGSLTDLSVLIQTQPGLINYDSFQNHFHSTDQLPTTFYETTSQKNAISPTHEQFVPDDQLLQSLVAYADSFELDASIYSLQNPSQPPTRRRTQSSTTHITSMLDNESLLRHKSCDDLSVGPSDSSSSKPTTVININDENRSKSKTTQFVPCESHPQFFFAAKSQQNEMRESSLPPPPASMIEKATDDGTSTTGGSKIEWGYSSDTMNEVQKPSTELFNNYEATTNIAEINLHYLQDLERVSSMAASMDFSPEMSAPFPPAPIIIRKKNKDLVLKQKVDIQLLRPPTPPAPAPIIIREIRSNPKSFTSSSSTTSRQSGSIVHKLENTGQIQWSKTPPPIILRERPPPRPPRENHSQPTIVYRQAVSPGSTVITERLRSNGSTIIQKPAPILIEKWLPYPPEQKRQIIYERISPRPIHKLNQHKDQPKQIIVEYENVNVIVDKEINQRKEIKRVRPEDYVKKFGNSLCSNETLSDLLTNVTCASQVIQNHSFRYILSSFI